MHHIGHCIPRIELFGANSKYEADLLLLVLDSGFMSVYSQW